MSETLTSINSKDARLLSAYIYTYTHTHTDLLEPNFQKLKSHKCFIKKHLFEIYQSFGIMSILFYSFTVKNGILSLLLLAVCGLLPTTSV